MTDLAKIATHAQAILDLLAVPVPDPGPTPTPDPVPTPDPAPVPDPVPTPIPAGDAASLLAAIAKGGTIHAGPGAYGVLKVNGLAPAQEAKVICDKAAHFERITFGKGSKNITFVSPRVWPDKTAPVRYNGVIHADASTANINIYDAKVMSAPDADDYLNWDVTRWQTRQTHGIVLQGPDSGAHDCLVKAIRIGIIIANDRCAMIRCKVRGFSEDGWRVLEDADDCLIDQLDVANAVKIDGIHGDGGQSWSEDGSNVVGSGDISNLVVRDLLVRSWIGPAGHPLKRPDLQGIGFHDGTYKNLTILNPEIWMGTWNGIRVAKVDGLVIDGAKVYDIDRKSFDRRIHVIGANVTIRNSVAGKVIAGGTTWTAAQMAAAGVVKPDYATLPAMSLVD